MHQLGECESEEDDSIHLLPCSEAPQPQSCPQLRLVNEGTSPQLSGLDAIRKMQRFTSGASSVQCVR